MLLYLKEKLDLYDPQNGHLKSIFRREPQDPKS